MQHNSFNIFRAGSGALNRISKSFYNNQREFSELLEGVTQNSITLEAIRNPFVLIDFGMEAFAEEFERLNSDPTINFSGRINNAIQHWLFYRVEKVYNKLQRKRHKSNLNETYETTGADGQQLVDDDALDGENDSCEPEADVEPIMEERYAYEVETEWQYTGRAEDFSKEEKKACYILENLCACSDEEEMNFGSVRRAKAKDRWRLMKLWIERFTEHKAREIVKRKKKYESLYKQKDETFQTDNVYRLRRAKIIGMTTTGAAKNRHLMERVRPRIVIVEEAAEVLEAHVISSLTSSCQHLILIGDHQQLRPKPTVYHLEKKYNLGVSLFERMINNGMPCVRLNEQHRMRPEIAKLLEPIYDGLKNHESVLEYKSIMGMEKDVYFIQHENKEDEFTSSTSHSNQYEVDYLIGLCKYLLLQGYKGSQITILTLYANQMFRIRDALKKMIEVRDVSAMVVDNYQGEEKDIILLLLVRSNNKGKTGLQPSKTGFALRCLERNKVSTVLAISRCLNRRVNSGAKL